MNYIKLTKHTQMYPWNIFKTVAKHLQCLVKGGGSLNELKNGKSMHLYERTKLIIVSLDSLYERSFFARGRI